MATPKYPPGEICECTRLPASNGEGFTYEAMNDRVDIFSDNFSIEEKNVLNSASRLCQIRLASIIPAFAVCFSLLCGTSMAADPVQARKDIAAIGTEYTGPNFAKAAGNGDLTVVQLFLDAGMDVNEGGGAAIGLAAGRGKTAMVKFLLSKGAKPTSDALQNARTRGYPEIEKILREAGAKE